MTEIAPPRFETDIRPLFREIDRLDMLFMFDLWAYDDVVENADQILIRLQDRTMPCDQPWADDHIKRFEQWIDAGYSR
jgi:hypothetical protein